MLDWLKNVFAKKHPSVDSFRLDTTGYDYQGEPDAGKVRTWHTEHGDGVSVRYIDTPPDLPSDLSPASIQDHYSSMLPEGLRVVDDVIVDAIDGCVAFSTVFATPQEPTGITYIAAWTVPFRDFCFVIKTICVERGLTGVREVVLLNRALAEGSVSVDNLPHASYFERATVDPEFPDHPLSRARQFLVRVKSTASIDGTVKRLARFALPNTC